MKGSTSYEVILRYVPDKLRQLMRTVTQKCQEELMEVRLRSKGPVYYVFADRIMFLKANGGLSAVYDSDSYTVVASEVNDCIDRLCHYSLHSCRKQLSDGFFVIENGIRAGISGVYSSSEPSVLVEFCSVNFRISRSVFGCADKLFTQVSDKNVLICGGVNSGKTTILRDLCRLTGSFYKTALIDERNEIACVSGGEPQHNVGIMTDIIADRSRHDGIISAVRTLSPDVIICDEIASVDDSEAVISGLGCGVRFIVTAHGENMKEIRRRKATSFLLESGFIDRVVFLCGPSYPGKIREIVRADHGF